MQLNLSVRETSYILHLIFDVLSCILYSKSIKDEFLNRDGHFRDHYPPPPTLLSEPMIMNEKKTKIYECQRLFMFRKRKVVEDTERNYVV